MWKRRTIFEGKRGHERQVQDRIALRAGAEGGQIGERDRKDLRAVTMAGFPKVSSFTAVGPLLWARYACL